MVTRFFQVTNSDTSSRSVSVQSKIWRTSWACVLAVSCGAWTGCQSTRMGRSDSIASLQGDEAEVEREARSSKGAFGSLFSRWWPTDSADEAYDLGLPRVEEDYVDSGSDASGRLSDKPSKPKASMTSPAEKRKNQFAKKTVADPLDEAEGLDASHRDLYRRQMEAMRRLGLTDDDLSDILAENSNNSGSDGIVQLPPVNNPISTLGNTNPAPHSLGSNSSAPKNLAAGNSTTNNDGARLKFSDDAPPPAPIATPAPPFAQSQPPQTNSNNPNWGNPAAPPNLRAPASSDVALAIDPPQNLAINAFPNTTNPTPSPKNQLAPENSLANTAPRTPELPPMEFQPLQPKAPVQNASNIAGPNDSNSIVTGPYLENKAQPTLSTNWESDVRQAVIKLQDRLAQDKTLTAKERTNLEARLRMMQLAANELDGAMKSSQAWSKDADEWFRKTLFSIHEATALTGPESPNQRFTLVAKHQQEASQHLLALSDLEVNNVAFCTEVLSYGQVVKRPANALTANEEVILYCEFNNFAALKVHDGFETEFEARYEIVDLQNNRIYEEKLPTDRQTSANRRRDYFIAYQMYLPKDIAPGHYRLKLNVKDVKAAKFGQGLVEFQIVK